jgi:glycolate oxidase iron-sulfur subunit
MSTSLPTLPLDPRTYERALSCVHCGLCLPACPTYLVTNNEADSPRGRIQLMRGMAEGKIEPTESVRRHLDLCLDCRGCETACPSGVVYHELIEETRAHLTESPPKDRLLRWMLFNILTFPKRLRLLLLPVRILERLGILWLLRKILPTTLQKMVLMLPPGPLWPPSLQSIQKSGKATVGFFTTCVGSVLFSDVNRKSAELLAAGGVAVSVPATQVCCGAIHLHNGDPKTAADMARRNIDAFLSADQGALQWITASVAGCTAMLNEYPTLLRDDPEYAEKARRFAEKVRDISVVLSQLNLPSRLHSVNQTVTYHDACHLAHAQKVTSEPRELLKKIPGLKMVPLANSDICCGAAGSYNLTQPLMATKLAERKLGDIAATGAEVCAVSNAGCALHLRAQAQSAGQTIRIVHPVELLHHAVFGR